MNAELENKDIEFYKELYDSEHNRSRYYDQIIQYPTTILVILIGGVIYCFNKYFDGEFPGCFMISDWVFSILLVVFIILASITIYFLYSVFHGFSRRYSYLPLSGSLYEYENQLFRYHYKYCKELTRDEKVNVAKVLTCNDLGKVLKSYYIELADANQKINDKRADNYYITRTLLFFDLVVFLLIAIFSFLI